MSGRLKVIDYEEIIEKGEPWKDPDFPYGKCALFINNSKPRKGQEEINKVYKLYKAQGLIDQNLPELSFPELRNRLFRLEENINKSYGEADFTPLTNINTYSSYLTSLGF